MVLKETLVLRSDETGSISFVAVHPEEGMSEADLQARAQEVADLEQKHFDDLGLRGLATVISWESSQPDPGIDHLPQADAA